jgi:hypothetical protein
MTGRKKKLTLLGGFSRTIPNLSSGGGDEAIDLLVSLLRCVVATQRSDK